MFVDDGAEEFSIPPAGGEVVAAQTLVSLHHPLRPQQQLLFGRHVVGLTVHLDVGDLEPEDEDERVRGQGSGVKRSLRIQLFSLKLETLFVVKV